MTALPTPPGDAAAHASGQRKGVETIDVCICCYERMTILETLGSLARQSLPDGIALKVIVADNNVLPLSRGAIERAADRLGLDVRYLHAPSGNISIARNRCLDSATAPWVAFLDDDEVAPPDWLARLVAARASHDVILGSVQALYPDPRTPRWMIAGDFHSTNMGPTDPPDKGFTCNVLIRRDMIERHALRFDIGLGAIGGEDTSFFKALHRLGARFAYDHAARLFEETPPDRATMGWLARRRFRFGQIHFLVASEAASARRRLAASAALKTLFCLVVAATTLIRPVRAASFTLRAMFHIGVVATWCGVAPLRGYGAAPDDRRPVRP